MVFRTRAKRSVIPINKGLFRVPLVRIFVLFYEQKMNEIMLQNVGTSGPCIPTCKQRNSR